FRKVLPTDQNLHLRMTMLNDFDLSEVAFAKGQPPQVKGNPERFEFVLARRKGKNLDSLFTTVYEPYKKDRYIEKTEQVPIFRTGGARPGANDTAKAVKVTLKNGNIDYVVYATNNKVEYRIDDKFDFAGFVGVYTLRDGNEVYSYLNDGTKLADMRGTDAYTGKVSDFTRDITDKNNITVTFDQAIDTELLKGKMIYIENGGTQNAVYEIRSASNVGGKNYMLDVGDLTMITGCKDPNDLAGGYNYNIAAGQGFRIPLITKNDSRPVFMPVPKLNATAGHQFNYVVSAKSQVPDRTLTYNAVTLPAGAQFDAETHEIKWNPSTAQVGENLVSIEASDGVFTAKLSFTVSVANGSGTGGTGGSGTGDGTGDGKPPEEKPDEKPKPPTEKVTAKDFTVKAADSAAGITEIKSDAGSITLRTGAFEKDAKGTFRITTKGDDIKVSLLVDGAEYKSDEMMQITINYVPSAAMPDPRCIVLKDKDGNIIANGEYKDGKVTFMTNALGEFTVGYNPKTFSDMGSHSWAEDAVISLAARGIINGTSEEEYSPGDNITRADFTTLVVRTLKLKVDKTGKNFDDIEPGAYYADAVAIAKALGIVGGQGDNKFNAMAEISREDMMVIMSRALLIAGYIFGGEPEHEDFKDAGDISDYAKEAIEMLVSSGLIAGNNGRINPKGKTTRAEVAVLLSRVVFG
ncbi:MAG: S-layer homology domain-containing protein, partial [Clostridia bacterium]